MKEKLKFFGILMVFPIKSVFAQDHVILTAGKDKLVQKCESTTAPFQFEAIEIPFTGLIFNGTTYYPPGGVSNVDFLFILKDEAGSIKWVAQLGGAGDEVFRNATINCSNNFTYIVGTYSGTATFGSTSFTSAGADDGFLVKLDNSNGSVLWAKTFGSKLVDLFLVVESDISGNAIVGGLCDVTSRNSGDFTISGTSTINLTPAPPSGQVNTTDIFLINYSSAGTFNWQQACGGLDGFEFLESIEISSNGKFYLVGSFSCFSGVTISDVYFGSNALTLSSATNFSSYIGYFNTSGQLDFYSSGTNCSAAKLQKGNSNFFSATDIDANDNLIIGSFWTTPSITFNMSSGPPSVFTNSSAMNVNSFVGRCDPSCNFDWVKNIYVNLTSGSPAPQIIINTLKLDKDNNIVTTGTVNNNPYYFGTLLNTSGFSGGYVGILNNDNSGTEINTWSGPNSCLSSTLGFLHENLKYVQNTYSVSGNAGGGTSCTQGFGSLSPRSSNYTYKFANIYLSSKSFTPVCAGGDIDLDWNVPFTPGGSNSYILELSDINGSFSNPTSIGSTSATAYTWTIPTNIKQSTKYRIRVRSTDPIFYSAPSNLFKISNPSNTGADFNYTSNCATGIVFFKGDAKLEGENITKWEWNFGSGFVMFGTSGNIPQATYVYSTLGPKTVVLRVTTSIGCLRTSSKTITIGNPKQPEFTFTKTCNGAATEFHSDYYDPPGNVIVYEWNWGDGTPNYVCSTASCTPSSGANPTHTYNPPSIPFTYNVTFTVTQSGGVCSTSVTHPLTIVDFPPMPTISSVPSNTNTCWDNQIIMSSSITSGYDFEWKENGIIVGSNSPYHNLTIPYISSPLNYTLTLSADIGCTTTSNLFVFTIHPLFSEIGASSTVICPASTVNLFPVVAYMGQTYYWEISTDQGITWSYVSTSAALTVSNPAWYRCLVSNLHCSNWSNVIKVTPWLNSTIVGHLGNLITPGSPIPLTVMSTSGSLSQIQWFLDGIPVLGPGGNPSYGASSPGNYYAISNGVCGPERTDEFPLYWNSVGFWDNTYQTGGTISTSVVLTNPNGYRFGNTLTVDAGGDFTISNSYLSMQPCAEIIVQNGGILRVDNTIIGTEDAQLWKRIYVKDATSQVHIINNSRVWNAEFSLIANNNPLVDIANSWFGNNGSHIADINNTIIGNVTINQNKFGHILDPGTSYICNPTSGIFGFTPIRGINLQFNGNGNVLLVGNNLYQNKKYTSSLASVGIVMRGGNANYITSTLLLGFYDTGISIVGFGNHQITNNIITRPHEIPFVLGINNLRQKTGIYCAQAKENLFDGNRLTNWENGIEYYRLAPVVENHTIFQNNKFLDNRYGLVIADVENPVCSTGTSLCSPANCSTANNINNAIYVKTQCNLFDNNYVGMIGSGNIQNQGDFVSPLQYSAGNRFQAANSGIVIDLNIDWGVLWQDNNLGNQYWFTGGAAYDDPKQIIGSTGIYCLNGNTLVGSNLVPLSGASPLTCSSVISRSAQKPVFPIDSINENRVLIYPNPANSQVVIESMSEYVIHFYVYDIHGKIALQGDAINGKIFVNTEKLSSGVYIFRFVNGDTRKIEILKD